MGRVLALPDFGTPANGSAPDERVHQADLQARWDDGYESGYQAGAAAAAQSHAEDQARLTANLVESLTDLQQTRQESLLSTLASAHALIRAVITQLTPRLAELGLADQVSAAVSTALESCPAPAPLIRCAPEAMTALQNALRDWEGLRLQPDPAMTPHEAEVHWDDGFDAINVTGLIRHVDTALADLAGPATPSHPHDLEEKTRNAG
jgi:flagellar biosynthesis/type III secretory pathway protein FliH